MTNEPTELLPCPFCGQQPNSQYHTVLSEDDGDDFWGIDCCQAFAQKDTYEDAKAAWNTRTEAAAEIKRLRDALGAMMKEKHKAEAEAKLWFEKAQEWKEQP